MNLEKAKKRISELKDAIKMYTYMVNRSEHNYNENQVYKRVILRHTEEIARIESLIHLNELEGDSHE